MIGSGATVGMRGIHLGIGVIGPVGGMYTVVGHMIGIGVTAMLSIIITIGVHSDMQSVRTAAIMSCIKE